jgi:membrane associated rhomboid family serine protease
MTSNDNKNSDDNDNVLDFKPARKKTNTTKTSQEQHSKRSHDAAEPMINLPTFTKYLLLTLIGIHLIVTFLLNSEQLTWVVFHLGFVPGRFTGEASFEALALLSPFSSMFLHGGWLHLAMNAAMLLAFGSGIERWIGGKKMIAFFVACGLFGITAHFALNLHSTNPVIGASAGISGLFAAALVMLNKNTIGMTGKFGLWPIAIIWVVISVGMGFIDNPQMGIKAGEIAWAAHVGGFLGGFAVLKMMRVI